MHVLSDIPAGDRSQRPRAVSGDPGPEPRDDEADHGDQPKDPLTGADQDPSDDTGRQPGPDAVMPGNGELP